LVENQNNLITKKRKSENKNQSKLSNQQNVIPQGLTKFSFSIWQTFQKIDALKIEDHLMNMSNAQKSFLHGHL